MRKIALLPALLPEIFSSSLMSCSLPNYLQEEVNRQNSTSSAPFFQRWVGDESLRDNKKKAAKCVVPQLSLSLSLNVSFIQTQSRSCIPLLQRIKQDSQMQRRTRHTQCRFPALFAPQHSLKRQSYPANDHYIHICVSVSILYGRGREKNNRNGAWKWDPGQKWCVLNRDRNGRYMWKSSLCKWCLVITAFRKH